jgi:26S proteasome regulatory subunit N10
MSSTADSTTEPKVEMVPTDNEEEAMLRQALAMSREGDVEMTTERDEDEGMDEDAAIAKAIEMSMRGGEEQDQQKK